MTRLLSVLFSFAIVLSSGAQASDLTTPEGRVILTVTGAIEHTNQGNTAVFDRDMLESLVQFTSKTATPWTDGVQTFSGPLGKTLLDKLGAKGTLMTVTALNDYSAKVPVADFYKYNVVLAMKADGKYMRVRDKGPLFIVYPFDQNKSLNSEVIHNRSVWQIKAIHIH